MEQLRLEIRSLHLQPRKLLEAIPIGVPEFENKLREYQKSGGEEVMGASMKDDILAIPHMTCGTI